MKRSRNKENGGSKKRRWLPVVLIGLLLVVVAGAGWLWITQGNNLKALYLAARNDKESLEQIQQGQDKKQDELLEKYGLTKPGGIQSGGETDLPTGESADPQTTDQPGQTSGPEQGTGGASVNPSDKQEELQKQLQEKINQLYDVEATYRGILDDAVAQTKAEYRQLPADQRTQSNKMAIVKAKANTLIAQEKQCDAQVYAILDEIRDILQQMGKSNELANEISSYYEESKANWKAAKMTELYS